MSIATLVRRLGELGATPEMIALAVEEVEANRECLDSRRTADRDRKRAQREAQKSANVTGQSAPCPGQTLSPFVPPKVSPEPLSNNPPISPIPEPINASAKFDLPDDIPAQPFAAFVEMRKAIGKKLTDNGKRLAVTKLRKLRDEDGWPPGEVLNHSTLNSYQGLFPPSKDRSNGQSRSQSSGVGVTGRAVAKALAGFDHGPPRTSYAR